MSTFAQYLRAVALGGASLALAAAGRGLSAQTTARVPQAASPGARTAAPAAYVIRGATIVPMVGARIPNGTVVIRGGKIEAAGAGVTAPADATIVDGAGLFVYPGMIDSGTQLGLEEIQSVPGSTDTQEVGEFNPHNAALTAVNPHSELIPVTRGNGTTSVITTATGNLVSGQATLIDLYGWTPDEMAQRPRAAMVMTYPRSGGGRFGVGGRGGAPDGAEAVNRQVTALRNYLGEARAYADTKARLGKTPAGRPVNLPMEAMVPVMRGEMPALFDVETADQIRGVLALADSFKLKVILRGASEAWRLADTLAARKIPVIVGPLTAVPSGDDPYDAVYANPGVLARAGVKIAFRTNDAPDARNLPYNAALATAYGLDPEEAMRALTINPAQIWGVGDRLGSIEPGKVANLMVTTGDPLDVRSVVRYLFIRGQMLPLVDRQVREYEQFKGRPKP